MATKVVNDLVTKFSFAGSLAPLAKYNSLLGTSIGKLGLWTAALAGGIALIDKWAHGVLEGVDSLDALAYQTRLSVAEIQTWNYMAEQNQSTASAMQSSLLSLGSVIGSAAQRGSEDFARLGISVRDANGHIKTSGQVLEEVRGRFRSLGLSIEEQRNFASALGIDPSLLRLLNRSSAELAELRNRAQQFGTLTDAQAKQAADYTKSVNALSFGMDSLRNIIAVGLAPEMERMASGFAKLLRENREWIVEGIQAATKWLGRIWDMFKRTLPYLVPFAAGIAAIKLAFVGLNGVLKAGLFVGLLLALDDLIVAFQGGKSVIADFFEQEYGVDVVEELTTAFRGLSEAIDTAFGWLRDFFGFLNRQGAETGKALVNLGLPEIIENPSMLNPLDETGRALGTMAADVVNWFRSNDSDRTSTSGARTIEQSNTFNVYTSDARAAARLTLDGLDRQLDNADTQLAVGGR